MNKTTILFVVVALIVGGLLGFFVERYRATVKMEDYKLAVAQQMTAQKNAAAQAAMKPTGIMTNSPILMVKGTGIITDPKGMTLYTFAKDTTNVSNCTGVCLQKWPPYVVNGQAPSNLEAGLSTFKRTDGSMQYTWKGMPLYYYFGDKKPGEITGDGVAGVWHVAK